VLGLRVKRERQDVLGKSFASYLLQLETENTADAQREIRVTLEALPPRQAKDILCAILTDPRERTDDRALTDVVAVLKAMPVERIGRIAEEFKTDAERALLHDILIKVGNFQARTEPAVENGP
jgi:hypothetical protein